MQALACRAWYVVFHASCGRQKRICAAFPCCLTVSYTGVFFEAQGSYKGGAGLPRSCMDGGVDCCCVALFKQLVWKYHGVFLLHACCFSARVFFCSGYWEREPSWSPSLGEFDPGAFYERWQCQLPKTLVAVEFVLPYVSLPHPSASLPCTNPTPTRNMLVATGSRYSGDRNAAPGGSDRGYYAEDARPESNPGSRKRADWECSKVCGERVRGDV